MKRLLTLIAFLGVATFAFSQSTTDIILKGHVLEAKTKEPLAGGTIILKGTKVGTMTDLNGAFQLTIKVKDTAAVIVVSFIGFEYKELKIKDFDRSKSARNVFSKTIFLEYDEKALSEVVVVGYATMKKTTTTGAVSRIKSSDMTSMPKTASAKKGKAGEAPRLTMGAAPAAEREETLFKAPTTRIVKTEAGVYKTVAIDAYAPASASFSITESSKTIETRDILKENKAIKTFAEDLIAIPEAADFMKELAKAKAIDQAKTPVKTALSEDDDIEPEPSAGQLTAGEWSDLKNWEFWKKSLVETFKSYMNDWKMNFTQRYSVILRGSNDQPISDATVQLIGKDGLAIWQAKTDNLGRAELFENVFNKTDAAKIHVQFEGKAYDLDKIKKIETGVNELKIPIACGFSPNIDIAFVVDATGSMGDEIAYLKAELADVIRKVKRDNQQLEVRLGSVFYRDFGDEYLTKIFPFDKSLKKNVEFIKDQSAGGGGDTPEAVEEGLASAIDSMAWSDKAVARLLFLVLDAPPHLNAKNIEKLQRLTAKAAEKGIKIIPITASGVDQNTEYLMKAFAVATGGTYTFLTDDSGIGGGHLKATTEKHEIELLNALLVRLIKQFSSYEACSELSAVTTTGGDTRLGLNFKVFPNPVRDVLNIDYKTTATNVFITNIQGQIVRQLGDILSKNAEITEGVQSVDVSDLQSGIYFVHFQKDEVVCTKKISVVK